MVEDDRVRYFSSSMTSVALDSGDSCVLRIKGGRKDSSPVFLSFCSLGRTSIFSFSYLAFCLLNFDY